MGAPRRKASRRTALPDVAGVTTPDGHAAAKSRAHRSCPSGESVLPTRGRHWLSAHVAASAGQWATQGTRTRAHSGRVEVARVQSVAAPVPRAPVSTDESRPRQVAAQAGPQVRQLASHRPATQSTRLDSLCPPCVHRPGRAAKPAIARDEYPRGAVEWLT
jgi:hypothetical protein